MINKQKVATLFTKYSIGNPMSRITTVDRSGSDPASQKTNTVSHHTVPVHITATIPEPCRKARLLDMNITAPSPASVVHADNARIMTQNSPGAQTSCTRTESNQHAPQEETRKRTRRLQFVDLIIPASDSTILAASPHKLAQGKRWKLMEPAPCMQFHPFVATWEQ